jgi:hypothetical protein
MAFYEYNRIKTLQSELCGPVGLLRVEFGHAVGWGG